MTIAACYVTPEGVVLGADSTLSTIVSAAGETSYHFFNHNQKLFEVGEGSTFGIVTWGLGGLEGQSHRTLIAQLADNLADHPPAKAEDVAKQWVTIFYPKYTKSVASVVQWTALKAKQPHDPKAAASPQMRTAKEEKEFEQLKLGLSAGFCIGGYCGQSRDPIAYSMVFSPMDAKEPVPAPILPGRFSFWGAPNMIERLVFGRDAELFKDIKASGKWSGSDPELKGLLDKYFLAHGPLPIRDAIDFIHTCIYSTIKAMKFSNMAQICGGPIELAVITTDRKFRWVRHKSWDAAVLHGE